MRILHTADWHLGHTMRDHARAYEHERFLAWLVDTVVERQVDALLIAGDVFDAANPPPTALRAWYRFLGDLKRARPTVQVVVIAGNHDSAARLEAPRELLAAFDVRVVGSLERDAAGVLQCAPLLVPLRGRDGAPGALCVAIPFLRASDVLALVPAVGGESVADAARDGDYVIPRAGEPAPAPERDPLLDGMRALHDELFTAARAQRRPGQALLAMAHGYLVGGALSELSERKVLGGNQHALPLDLFPDDCAYVALGHLHRPQGFAGREHIRYSGSPLPLSMPERLHAHHVVFCDLDGERVAKTWSLRVPRAVEMVRVPEHGACSEEQALAAVRALPPRDAAVPSEQWPFVEVAVRVAQPSPLLGERIAQAIADRHARLVRVEVLTDRSDGVGGEGGEAEPVELASFTPEQVFVRRCAREHQGEPPAALLGAFRELLEQVQHEGPA